MLVTFIDSEDSEDSEETDSMTVNKIDKCLQKIEKDSTKNDSGNRPNPYYCPNFGKRLLKLNKHFVLWTACITSAMENTLIYSIKMINSSVATFACSEKYFR